MDAQVLIVGAGPTGLTLAIDLGRRGVRTLVIEQKDAPQFLPKMERCNARTMEIYRRMGIVDQVRAAGLPARCPMDIFVVLSLVEPPLVHHEHPSVAEARAQIAKPEDGSQPLEPYQLISQYTLEPLLKSIAETLPSITVRYGCELVSFEQDESSVTAQVKGSNGALSTLRAAYMIGCDGGGSLVRRQLGIDLSGEANIQQLRQALYYCEDLYERIPIGKGRHYHVADAEGSFLIVQDSTRHFTLHSVVETDAEMAGMFERVVAMPVKYEMLYVGQWRMNLLLADRYGEGRVFLAGDAVHLVIPTGGLGMNTGVGDAIDLSWKLAATLAGWGGPNLLAAYEIERRQVGARNVAASGFATQGRRGGGALYRPGIRPPPCAAGAAEGARTLSAGNSPADGRWRGAASRARARRRRRAAQGDGNDRRRTRLPLCRLAADRRGAGRGAQARFHDIRCDHMAGSAAAACVARRRQRVAGPHRLRSWLHAAAFRRGESRYERVAAGVRRHRRAAAGSGHRGRAAARRLRT